VAVAEPIELPALDLPKRVRRARRPRSRRWSWIAASMFGVVTLVALLAPVLSPEDPIVPVGQPLASPGTSGYLLGSDSIGRDILSRVLFGMRASWFAALAVIAVGVLVGGVIGLVAGAAGGWIDNILMRVTDGVLALPAPVLAIAVTAALGPDSYTHSSPSRSSGGRFTRVSSAARSPNLWHVPTSRPPAWPGPDGSASRCVTCFRVPFRRPWSPRAWTSVT
jgi:peptide/nickel transport system permease protein